MKLDGYGKRLEWCFKAKNVFVGLSDEKLDRLAETLGFGRNSISLMEMLKGADEGAPEAFMEAEGADLSKKQLLFVYPTNGSKIFK